MFWDLSNPISLLWKSVLLSKLACFNLAAKTSAVTWLNYWVVIYLAWSWVLFSTLRIFVLRIVVVTKLLVSSILLLTWLTVLFKTIVIAKSLVSGIFLSTSSICFPKFCLSALYWFLWIKVFASGIFSSKLFTFVFSLLNFVFLTTSLSTKSLNF